MARLSKSHRFQIFQDTGIPTPPGDENDPFNDTATNSRDPTTSSPSKPASQQTADDTALNPLSDPPSDNESDDADGEHLPRDSLTSVSSFPESTTNTNTHHNVHDASYTSPPPSPQKFFTPQIIRPSFRRPESVRRMQMTSPRASPRQSMVSHHRASRSGTPRSEKGRGRGRGRRITEDLSSGKEQVEEEEKRAHPLVLLHVTLLPINLPWSMESMREILPEQVMEDLLLLKSKVSETVAQRGILIPHPREEYEMLEERLLEALELKEERVTKCGHFLGRSSSSLTSQTLDSSDKYSDSGLGSSSSSDDEPVCATCRHHIHCKPSKKQKWNVKVFAANGLMRSSAWSAAWDGMESVDVETLPWIGEEERRKLDLRREAEEREERERWREEEIRYGEETRADGVGRELLLGIEAETGEDVTQKDCRAPELTVEPGVGPLAMTAAKEVQAPSESLVDAAPAHELPPIYRASQVPLSVLLRNYIYLLAQDRRNVVMFFLGILALFFAVRSGSPRADATLVSYDFVPLKVPSVVPQNLVMPEMQQEVHAWQDAAPSSGATISGTTGEEDKVADPQLYGIEEAPQGEEDSPRILESAKETISVMLADDGDEAIFEADEELVQPESDDAGIDIEKTANALDDEAHEMME